MSIAEPISSETLVPRTTVNRDGRSDLRRRALAGCRLGRALADQLSAESEQPAVWAVGSVTVDDLSRFASGG